MQQCNFRLFFLPWALQHCKLAWVLCWLRWLSSPVQLGVSAQSSVLDVVSGWMRVLHSVTSSSPKYVSAKTACENESSKVWSTSGLRGMGDTHQKTFPSQKLVFRLNLVVGTTTKGLNSSVQKGTAWEKLIPQEVLWEYFFHADMTLFRGVH